ncbi:hypothetical protein [Flagellimonas algicola]|uniref:Lipocalin-like domain-containing protein n=1 Tax=Flagellimonas algicola TaxID=2583815 RepID=A0ABY2WLP8_9FLAO|nr:hypothetical protein [Allomuricauda algicola]TMU55446.1 hypothetical protein FGG15_14840 [Allomuricauda algicola]
MRNFLFAFLMLVLSSCTSDDDINPSDDKWVLDNVVCFCFFGEDFDFSVHSIRFDEDSGMVTIENTGDSEFIAPAGTYPFTDNGSVIGIEGREYTYEEDGDSLILTYVDNPQIADDEITYYYSKN